MGQLINLKGTNGKAIDCKFIKKGSEIRSILKSGIAATTAGNNGAINIYTDDNGDIRCEAMRFMVSLEEKVFQHIKDAINWTNEWLPKIK
jgi:hypothetical protein